MSYKILVHLIHRLYDKALDMITDIESSHDGMTKYIESGMAKIRIEESATRKQARIDAGLDVVVGVNKYQVSSDTTKQQQSNSSNNSEQTNILTIDNALVRQKQIDKLQALKADRQV